MYHNRFASDKRKPLQRQQSAGLNRDAVLLAQPSEAIQRMSTSPVSAQYYVVR